jgi:membrane-bound lytic murein transglycosylase D
MSLVHRIPPLISALAFGYGVGMAAPDGALDSVHSAVHGAARPVVTTTATAPGSVGPLPPLPALSPARVYAEESRELGRLRDAGAPRDPRRLESTDVDRPTYSRAPRLESREGAWDEADDLDASGSEALSKLQLPDLRVSITRRTLRYVKFFARTDRGRGMFETWLKRSGRYQDLVQSTLREWRLPEDLLWVAMIESGFDARAKSPAGAVGLWQFMPATGDVYGLAQNRYLDQRKNPRLATLAAAHHLRDLYMRFGDWDLALAAYNMGYEQLLDAIDRYGTADFNELARQEAIPAETAAYVPKIAAAAIVANNLEHFGFDRTELARPVDAGEVAVPPGTPLRTLAKAAGVSTAALRALNPDLLGDKVPPGRGDFLLLVPSDTISRAQAALPSLLDTEPLAADEASVLDPVDLVAGRELTKRRAARDDESLLSLLPSYRRRHTMRSPLDDVGADAPADRISRELSDDEDVEDGPRRGHRARSGRKTMLFRVGAGDSLASVARQLAVDVDDVARENHLEPDAKLKEGSLLKVRVRPEAIEKASADDAVAPHAKPAADRPTGRDEAAEPKAKKRAADGKHRKPRHERG